MSRSQGWHPDPNDRTLERYWDGTAWTEQTRTAPLTQSGVLGGEWKPAWLTESPVADVSVEAPPAVSLEPLSPPAPLTFTPIEVTSEPFVAPDFHVVEVSDGDVPDPASIDLELPDPAAEEEGLPEGDALLEDDLPEGQVTPPQDDPLPLPPPQEAPAGARSIPDGATLSEDGNYFWFENKWHPAVPGAPMPPPFARVSIPGHPDYEYAVLDGGAAFEEAKRQLEEGRKARKNPFLRFVMIAVMCFVAFQFLSAMFR